MGQKPFKNRILHFCSDVECGQVMTRDSKGTFTHVPLKINNLELHKGICTYGSSGSCKNVSLRGSNVLDIKSGIFTDWFCYRYYDDVHEESFQINDDHLRQINDTLKYTTDEIWIATSVRKCANFTKVQSDGTLCSMFTYVIVGEDGLITSNKPKYVHISSRGHMITAQANMQKLTRNKSGFIEIN